MPLYAGASNKVILAFLDDRRRNQVVQEAAGKPLATGESVDRESLGRQLEEIEAAGYCLTDGEINHDTTGLACPILHGSRVVGSLTVAGPSVRMQAKVPVSLKLLQHALEDLKGAWS